jgi:hypothetical protein
MVRNVNTITVENVRADNGIVWRPHKLEELNTLIEVFFDRLVIGTNNSLRGHAMSAQTVRSRPGSSCCDQQNTFTRRK